MLERRDLRLWCLPSFVFGRSYHALKTMSAHGSPGGALRTKSPSRKRASIPNPEQMVQAAPAFGTSPSEKWTLDLVTDHPMIPREHLARWLGVSEGRVSQMMHSLVDTWGLVERRGKRGETRYTLSAEGIRYVTHRDRAQLPTTRGIWSTALTTDRRGRRRHVGHRIDTWALQTKHADGITWFLPKLEAEARADPDGELLWSVPTARSDRAFNWGESAIAPDAVGKMIAGGLPVPFYLEYELRARHPKGRLGPLETLHKLLLVSRSGRGPAAVPHHSVRRGHLREHSGPGEFDVTTHPRVMLACSVMDGDIGTVLASPLGAGFPTTGAVRAKRLQMGLALPPDASCRGDQIGLIQPYLPVVLDGGCKGT